MGPAPLLAHLLIVGCTLFVIYQLYRALGNSRIFLVTVLAWSFITAVLGITGFYRDPQALPPRFVFLVAPGVGLSVIMLMTGKGRKILDKVSLADLTLMQSVRFPVEILLYLLFSASLVPGIMTFEGNNFDIVTGLTAPLIFYLVFKLKVLHPGWLLGWNLMGILLLFVIMIIAILASPTPFQQFGFEQPNTGVTYFPFVWLPGIIVPAALFAHVASIRQLTRSLNEKLNKFSTRTKVRLP